MTLFDPNASASEDSGIFGLPFTVAEAKLVLLPLAWEVTTSYGSGTANAPQAILAASKQVDLFDVELGNIYKAGIAMIEASPLIEEWNGKAKKSANLIREQSDSLSSQDLQFARDEVNQYSLALNHYVYSETKKYLSQGKCVGIIGGDHSVPLGAIEAHLEKYPRMGILHIDAHADLRKSFEGFDYSHASIMYNVMTNTSLAKLVQVGIRDLCEEEFIFIRNHSDRMVTFYDSIMSQQKMEGKTWSLICAEIVEQLPQEVYVSFDIDGLDPRFCPHTGTPVPGGLDFHEALYLLKAIVKSGRHIIGFDLNEVSLGHSNSTNSDPASEWDANVGARLLYKLCGWTMFNCCHP